MAKYLYVLMTCVGVRAGVYTATVKYFVSYVMEQVKLKPMRGNMERDELKKVIEKIAKGNEQQAYDFLEEAMRSVYQQPHQKVMIEGNRIRYKWRCVQKDYQKLREQGHSGEVAIYTLAKRYKYSVKTIEKIVYAQ